MVFDESQLAVIALERGRHKVFAPPGSGKTELLATRAKIAVARGVDPQRMACMTFTNRAARAMVERMDRSCRRVFVGNFHSFGARHLRRVGRLPLGGAILDEEDARLVAKEAVENALERVPARKRKALELELGDLVGALARFADASRRRRLGLDAEVIAQAEIMLTGLPDGVSRIRKERPDLHRFLLDAEREYLAAKEAALAVDFDDLLNLTAHSLAAAPRETRATLDWVQVDEAQDLNAIQWWILSLLTREDSHVVLLGDDRQSIFSFMGSSLPRLARATADFTEHSLVTNYRSPPKLLRLFERYATTKLHAPLRSRAFAAFGASEGTARLVTFASNLLETDDIVHEIERDEALRAGSCAILSRTNFQTEDFSRALEARGIRHFLVAQFDLFRTANAKDFMAFLQILRNGGNRVAWTRLFRLFKGTSTLKAARPIVNDLFDAGIGAADLIAGAGSVERWSLRPLLRIDGRERVVVFDVETTGLDPDTADIVQIAAVELRGWRRGETLSTLLRTDKDLGETTAIHGITVARLERDGSDRKEALARFVDFVSGATLVAHNLAFDWGMLEANLARAGLAPLPSSTKRICTLEVAKTLHPRLPRHTLAGLLEALKVRGRNTHDALDDASATAYLLERLFEDARRAKKRAARAFTRWDAAISKVGLALGPLVRRLMDFPAPTTFGDVFDAFREHVSRVVPNYEWLFEKDLREKLIRHMNATSAPAPLPRLLADNLGRYLLYREPDLIMDDDRVVVSTVHRAKGLEFDTVFVPAATDDNYPYAHTAWDEDPAEIAEEARVFFVALTRARRHLLVSEHRWRFGPFRPKPCRRTRFLAGLADCFDDAG